MPVTILTADALTRLTPAEKRVAEHLVAGTSNIQGAQDLGMSAATFAGHLASIGRKFQITNGRLGRPARAHAVLASEQVAPPQAPATVPDFTPAELRLLCAFAKYPEIHDITRATGIAQAEVRPHIKALVTKAGADNDTHLIGLGHAWGFLGECPTASDSTAEDSNKHFGAAR
ncbi:LuxR C-terminal-related transcriptional regulator [Streptomyces sp. NPDC102441]|uniref:LuxR C-terminal-related transcriptional regulator n=1 Tax=Streptomyces sp. NPDC102441 TaxID=3366176 RepID=UPI00382DAEAE